MPFTTSLSRKQTLTRQERHARIVGLLELWFRGGVIVDAIFSGTGGSVHTGVLDALQLFVGR